VRGWRRAPPRVAQRFRRSTCAGIDPKPTCAPARRVRHRGSARRAKPFIGIGGRLPRFAIAAINRIVELGRLVSPGRPAAAGDPAKRACESGGLNCGRSRSTPIDGAHRFRRFDLRRPLPGARSLRFGTRWAVGRGLLFDLVPAPAKTGQDSARRKPGGCHERGDRRSALGGQHVDRECEFRSGAGRSIARPLVGCFSARRTLIVRTFASLTGRRVIGLDVVRLAPGARYHQGPALPCLVARLACRA